MKPNEETPEITKDNDESTIERSERKKRFRIIFQRVFEMEITEELRAILLEKLSSLD